MCVSVCRFVHVSPLLMEARRGTGSPGNGDSGACGPSAMGAGNRTQGPLYNQQLPLKAEPTHQSESQYFIAMPSNKCLR